MQGTVWLIPPAVLAGLVILRYLWRGATAFFRVQEAMPVLYKIAKEFEPNSGHSMKDRIEVLAEGQRLVFRRLDHQDRKIERLDAAAERIEDQLKKP